MVVGVALFDTNRDSLLIYIFVCTRLHSKVCLVICDLYISILFGLWLLLIFSTFQKPPSEPTTNIVLRFATSRDSMQ